MISKNLTTAEHQPLVSVIMNCLNCERYLQEAIDSVYAQTYLNWEIIFYDNASSDSSADIAQCHDSRLHYVRGDATIPLGAARNEAISRAQGDLVAFLDCDDRWLPVKLEQQVALFLKYPDVDFAYANFFFTRPGGARLHLGFKRKQPQNRVFGKFLIYFPVNLQTVMIRKSALDKLSELFDISLDLAEDYDLFLRLLYAAKAAYMDQPLAIYRMHSGMSTTRYAEKWPDEMAYCIEKLKVLHPEMEQDYRKELAYFDAKVAYLRAKAAMLQRRSGAARAFLEPHKDKGLAFMGLYYAAYLPPGLWVKLQDLRLFLR
jgi:glycosyltransferase involved in cell wall biosynthesis